MALSITDLRKDYDTPTGPLPVLKGVSMSLNPGDAIAITGPSGSGKSTFLQLVGTLDKPTSGSINLDGVDPLSLTPTALAAFRNRRVGFVFQDHHLLPQFNVLENVLLPTLVDRSRTAESATADAKQLLDRVGLSPRLTHRPSELSGGERQRVAIARALIQKPLLVLADEPTGNLDRVSAKSVGEMLLELQRELRTILIVVTHSRELADTFTVRYEMNEGSLLRAN